MLPLLFEGLFDEYFKAARSGTPLWLFSHVPKTAGSSFNAEMVRVFKPNFHIFINHSDTGASYEEQFDKAVGRFLAASAGQKPRFATGHITARNVVRIRQAIPDVRPFTLLREPVSRVISDYRYQLSPMHPPHEQFARDFPTLESYVEMQGDWNKAAYYLIPLEIRQTGDASACVDYLLSNYAFVGIQEMYGLSLRVMSTFGGAPRRSEIRKRINQEAPLALSPELRSLICERNALDIGVYDILSRQFRAISAGLEAYLDQVAPMPPMKA